MASYLDLYNLKENTELRNRIAVACMVAAETVCTDSNPPANQDARLAWAARVFANPELEARRMMRALVAANKDLTIEQIENADDTQIQTRVDGHIDLFADNG